MRPLDLKSDGRAPDDDQSVEAVIVAAQRTRGARSTSSDADDGKGRACQADEDVQILKDNAEQSEDEGRGGVGCEHSALAALDGAGVALRDGRARSWRRRRRGWRRCGNRKKREEEE